MINYLSSYQFIREIGLFALLALIRTVVIDIIGWQLLVSWMRQNSWSWKYVEKFTLNIYSYAHAITFIISSVSSYYLNRFIAFSKPNIDDETRVFVEFMSISVASLILSVGLINYLTKAIYILLFVEKIPIVRSFWPLIAKMITIAVIMIINFVGYKFLVFD